MKKISKAQQELQIILGKLITKADEIIETSPDSEKKIRSDLLLIAWEAIHQATGIEELDDDWIKNLGLR